jgi:hypothetical protein
LVTRGHHSLAIARFYLGRAVVFPSKIGDSPMPKITNPIALRIADSDQRPKNRPTSEGWMALYLNLLAPADYATAVSTVRGYLGPNPSEYGSLLSDLENLRKPGEVG